MVTVVGVRFKAAGKVYYFDPAGFELGEGSHVIVETARGLEYGEVTSAPCEINEKSVVQPLKRVVRIADKKDEEKHKENMKKKQSALDTCQKKINARGLDMKLIDVEYTFDNSKVIFYFTADGRVDFRELVKDLASVFKMRIELRQIGVRDEAKMLGGIGTCGKGLCCHTWLADFEPVSIKMAKVQGLSLNPTKISGICGRLMCCLKYENDAYHELKKGLPDVGEKVKTPEGEALVVDTNVLREQVKTRLILEPDKNTPKGEDKLSQDVSTYKKSEVKRIDKKKHKKRDDESDSIENLPDEVKNLLGD
jgi:cell fate regulator YaaT (PSP1 superfamily)